MARRRSPSVLRTHAFCENSHVSHNLFTSHDPRIWDQRDKDHSFSAAVACCSAAQDRGDSDAGRVVPLRPPTEWKLKPTRTYASQERAASASSARESSGGSGPGSEH